MNISTTINTSAVMAALKKVQPSPQLIKKALGRAASGHVKDMEKRVDSGVGLNGRFKPYHPKYAEYRASKGRRTDIVNLQFTGEMLGNVGVKLSSSKAVVGFSSQKFSDRALSNQRKRPWFGANDNEEKQILSRFKREIFL
jgi:hypothetical protein